MTETNEGKFKLETYDDGYPHWVTLFHDGLEIARFHHQELSDLEYAVSRHRELLKVNAKHTDNNEI